MSSTRSTVPDPRFSPHVRVPVTALDWRWQIAVSFLAALIVFSRRPDAFLYPQFYGEDGTVWYLQAYTLGLFHPLAIPYAGYFQTLPRLAADLAVLFPLRLAPLVMNLAGLVFQILPAPFLLSSRCAKWAPLSTRILMAVAYLCLPNSFELDVSVTNAQWHCALIAILIVIAEPARTAGWPVFDVFLLAISGLTGPFCILLLPLTIIMWFLRRQKWTLVQIAVIAVCCTIQSFYIFGAGAPSRIHTGLGASAKLFVDILAGHVFLEAIGGTRDYVATHSFAFLLCAALIGCAALAYCLAFARAEIKLLVGFCLLIFAASLLNPKVSDTEPQWRILNLMYGARYWFFPTIALVWSLIWCATTDRNKSLVRWAAAILLFCMIFGVFRDWEYPAYPNRNFSAYAQQFENAKKGTTIAIPEYPDGWQVKLTKQ